MSSTDSNTSLYFKMVTWASCFGCGCMSDEFNVDINDPNVPVEHLEPFQNQTLKYVALTDKYD